MEILMPNIEVHTRG